MTSTASNLDSFDARFNSHHIQNPVTGDRMTNHWHTIGLKNNDAFKR